MSACLFACAVSFNSASADTFDGIPAPSEPVSAFGDNVVWPNSAWQTATPAEMGMDEALLAKAEEFAQTGGGSGMIIRGGKLVYSWGDPAKRYDLKSSTKSIGVTALGLAVLDQRVSLTDPAVQHLPDLGVPPASNKLTGWLDDVTVMHLATQSAGFDKLGGFANLLFAPGTSWSYSDSGANWLADLLTVQYRTDLRDLLFSRVFGPIGIGPDALTWRDNIHRDVRIDSIPRREFGSGIESSVDAMARIGYLYLRGGEWNGQRLLPEAFVEQVSRPAPSIAGLPVLDLAQHGNAPDHYGLLWWNNGDGSLPGVPTDAYWSWGLGDSLIVVIPSLDLVIARAGDGFRPDWNSDYSVIEPLLAPIAQSVTGITAFADSPTPYPQSTFITDIQWAPAESVVRAAHDSDTWPITWGDDDALYTAFGDGHGFEQSEKLSLGFAKVVGGPTDFSGIDIPSPTGEQSGFRHTGKKASGMLMVNSMLYAWLRNANENGEQCQLTWSADHAVTWEWSPWKFEEFGYCAFLNFGQNYADARDSFVYMYTPDTPSAYEETDSVVLTRVPMDQITDRNAYQYFTGVDASGEGSWSPDIAQRKSVLTFPGAVNRLDVTYNAPLDRYLLSLSSRANNGGIAHFSLFEAPDPWGPWSTVYYDPAAGRSGSGFDWGEAQHIPSKWISADGTIFNLVFSGEDAFSVRQATLTIASDGDAPSVNIVTPSDGSELSGTVSVTAQASDDTALQSVDFTANGTSIGTDSAAPYEASWDTSTVGNGVHELTATATDDSGNQSSDTIDVSVASASGTPPPARVTMGGGGGGSAGWWTLAALALLAVARRRRSVTR